MTWRGPRRRSCFGAILAALLPYLSPKRLFRSGMSPDSKPLERYLFVIATRALLYGLPFLLVSYFARENISGWNELRDDSITLYEISDWNRMNPRTVGETAQVGEGYVVRWWNPDQVTASASDGNVAELFTNLQKIELQLNVLDSPMDALGRERLAHDRVLGQEELSRWRRWRYFGELIVPASVGSYEDVQKNVLYQIWIKRGQVRTTRLDILDVMNRNMLKRDFYKKFAPGYKETEARFAILARFIGTKLATDLYQWVAMLDKNSSSVADRWNKLRASFAGNSDKQKWVDNIQIAYDNAARLDAATVGEAEPPPKWRQWAGLTNEKALAFENLERARLAAHRRLMEAYYNSAVTNKSTVYSIVVRTHDQRTRMTWFAWSLGIFLVAATFVSLNATSWHGFYATRIANMWIEPVRGVGRDIPLAQLDTTRAGYPYHLINASLQLMGRKEGKGRYLAQDHFLFSQLYCGSDRLKAYCASDRYMGGSYALTDAIAISGAAISPLHAHNPLLQALLVLGNVRLGQWVDNPAACEKQPSWLGKLGRWLWVSPLRLMLHWFQPAERRPFCFVTDGGHHENLGIESLLKRRCRLIIACDAGQDDRHSFLDLSRVLTRMRLEEGITLRSIEQNQQVMKLDSLVPEVKERYTKDHFLFAEIVYPEERRERSYLIYIKSSLTGDEPTELVQHHRLNALFPHDPTADQFYGPERFAPYAQLGSHMAEILCRHLPATLDNGSPADFIQRIVTVPPRPPGPTMRDSIATVTGSSDHLADSLSGFQTNSGFGIGPSSRVDGQDSFEKRDIHNPLGGVAVTSNTQTVPATNQTLANDIAATKETARKLEKKLLRKHQRREESERENCQATQTRR